MSRVLIIDDSPSVLRLLQAVFEGENYEVVTASDGMEGLEKARQCQPDLVVTDSLMPGLDGFEVLQRLKDHPATGAVPVIMLTSSDPGDAGPAENGAVPDAFVKKSADVEPLLAEVRRALNR
jgi:CheY-like chemotaxis protein